MKNSKKLSEQEEEVTDDLLVNPGMDETNEIELFINKMNLQNRVLKKLTESLNTNETQQTKLTKKE